MLVNGEGFFLAKRKNQNPQGKGGLSERVGGSQSSLECSCFSPVSSWVFSIDWLLPACNQKLKTSVEETTARTISQDHDTKYRNSSWQHSTSFYNIRKEEQLGRVWAQCWSTCLVCMKLYILFLSLQPIINQSFPNTKLRTRFSNLMKYILEKNPQPASQLTAKTGFPFESGIKHEGLPLLPLVNILMEISS